MATSPISTLYFPVPALELAADSQVYGETVTLPNDIDYTLEELPHNDFFNNGLISRDVLQAAFIYESINNETIFRFTNNPAVKKALISSLNKCLSFNTLHLFAPNQYPSRLDPDRSANPPDDSNLPLQFISFLASLLFSNSHTTAPISNKSEIIRQMQEGLAGLRGILGAGPHTLGDQAVNYIESTVDINNQCPFTKNLFEQMLANVPDRFSQTDISDYNCLPVPFYENDILILDVLMRGTLSVDTTTASGNLMKTIVQMFPPSLFNRYFTYTAAVVEDGSVLPANSNDLITLKPFKYRIKMRIADTQEISSDSILYANKVINSLFSTVSVPVDNTLTIISNDTSSAKTLESLTNTVYNGAVTSELQQQKNKEAMNALYAQVQKLAKELQIVPNLASPRDTIKIITSNLLVALSNCMTLFVNVNVEELALMDTNNKVINIVGIVKSIKVCTKQLAVLQTLVYNPIMNTIDMYYCALRQIGFIVAAIEDIGRYSTNLIDNTVNQSTLAYPFSRNMSVAAANAAILAFANKKYLEIDPLTHLPVTTGSVQLTRPEKISDLITMDVLPTISYMFISLANSYSITNKNINENRRNYPDPNIVNRYVDNYFNSVMSIDLASAPNTFMPKLFLSVTSMCDLMGELLTPYHFDLKGYSLTFIHDTDRKNLLEALSYGAHIIDGKITYSYNYTAVSGGLTPSTLKFGSNTNLNFILDGINNLFTSTAQMYDSTLPLRANSEIIGQKDANIDGDLIQTVNPSSDITSTATNELIKISNKVDEVINVKQYDSQVAEIKKLLVDSNLTQIEAFSFALLNTLAFSQTKSLLRNAKLVTQRNYSQIQDNVSRITTITNSSGQNYDDAIAILTYATSPISELDTALESGYYAITQNNLQTAMIYISIMTAIAQAIFDLNYASLALLNKLQNTSSDIQSDEYDFQSSQSDASLIVFNNLKASYGSLRPVILEAAAASAGPGVLTTIYNMIVSGATSVLLNAQTVLSEIPETNTDKDVAQTTVTQMTAYKNTLAGITFVTPMGSNLAANKRLFRAIVLATTIGKGQQLVIAIADGSNIAEKQTDYSTQKAYTEEVSSATP